MPVPLLKQSYLHSHSRHLCKNRRKDKSLPSDKKQIEPRMRSGAPKLGCEEFIEAVYMEEHTFWDPTVTRMVESFHKNRTHRVIPLDIRERNNGIRMVEKQGRIQMGGSNVSTNKLILFAEKEVKWDEKWKMVKHPESYHLKWTEQLYPVFQGTKYHKCDGVREMFPGIG